MGSATKLYTATALLRLQELGVLDLDATAASIVDPFLNRTNGTTLAQLWGTDVVNNITVRQLASTVAWAHGTRGRLWCAM